MFGDFHLLTHMLLARVGEVLAQQAQEDQRRARERMRENLQRSANRAGSIDGECERVTDEMPAIEHKEIEG